MNSEDIGLMPAVELAELILNKRISPVEYMQVLLARIAELEPKVNAFAYRAADRPIRLNALALQLGIPRTVFSRCNMASNKFTEIFATVNQWQWYSRTDAQRANIGVKG
ncbi:hypothetical protein NKH70_33110 [Mesorhizobium sp. M0991]|uniref:hypothetical protein n=1 Tax=Mesorhizobium sp. M0991 TaxID=2957043 RepID=UPI00333BBA87